MSKVVQTYLKSELEHGRKAKTPSVPQPTTTSTTGVDPQPVLQRTLISDSDAFE